MWQGRAFDEWLDRKLAPAPTTQPAAERPPTRTADIPHPLLFAEPQRRFGAHAYGWTRRDTQPSPSPAEAVPRRQVRTLTEPEHAALQELVRSGASLVADFSATELRSAFRALARRYHPDRHPFSTDVEKARLSRVFVKLSEHYRLLQAALDRDSAPMRH
jgi:hypothetical protein